MNILVINGDCLERNSSANLCHLAYLRGLVDAGHRVSLLSADGRDYALDPAMQVPGEVRQHLLHAVSFYERLSLRKRAAAPAPGPAGSEPEAPGWKQRLVSRAKRLVLASYGPHGIYATFARKARRFRAEEPFDCVLSISDPPVSHLVAWELIRSGRVQTEKWIQIWEDPWAQDIYGVLDLRAARREEGRLLAAAQHVCYVSPLTMENQKRLFPESAHKMYWQPLPYYYKEDGAPRRPEGYHYGYFGDYSPGSRNLEPFYQAAVEAGVPVNICGNPADLFPSASGVRIHPRLPLDELKPIEDGTNVLVFLCNRQGGQIPGKIYQYSATSKVILFIMDGTQEEQRVLRAFFEPFRRYIFCENTKESIAAAIRRIESGDFGEVENLPLEDFAPDRTIANILNCEACV